MRSLRYQLEPVSSQCKDTQEQHIQGLGLQGAQRNKDIPVVLDPHLQVKALTDQELLLRVKAIQEPENLLPDPRDIQGLELHLDNKDMEEHLLSRDMVVEQLLKGMQDSNNSSRGMVVQLFPPSRAEAMLQAHL